MRQCCFAVPVFKKRKRDSASFVSFPGVPRRGNGWVIFPVNSFPSLTGTLGYGSHGDVIASTLELKQGLWRGCQNVSIGQWEEYKLDRRWKGCMKDSFYPTSTYLTPCQSDLYVESVGSSVVRRWLLETHHNYNSICKLHLDLPSVCSGSAHPRLW